MSKQTKLSESAEIYQKREELTEKEKLRNMSFKEKLEYLWEYYRIHALVFIICVSIVVSLVYTILKPKIDTKLYVAVINNTIPDDLLEDISAQLEERLQLNQEKEKVFINSQFYFNGSPDYAANMETALATYVAAQDVDIIIAPQSEFKQYADSDFMVALSDILPTDLYTSLTDKFYITGTKEFPEETAYGIYLSDTDLFKNNSTFTKEDPYILGIVANTRHQENDTEFIRYLFE